jgi:predicted Zn-dependent protease
MNLRLVSASGIAKPCAGNQCKVDQAFDRQVNRLGSRLADAAFASRADLKERVPAFDFVIADKSEAGTASNADGTIVVYRGIYKPGLDETLLAFLIAREMGHVIARHHDEKSAVSLIASVVVGVLMPATNLAGAVAFLAGSAASTAGANIVAPDGDPAKTREATTIAIALLQRQGWHPGEVNRALSAYAGTLEDNEWKQSIRDSLAAFPAADTRRQVLALDESRTLETQQTGPDAPTKTRHLKAPPPMPRMKTP